jgi:hypothetical protein
MTRRHAARRFATACLALGLSAGTGPASGQALPPEPGARLRLGLVPATEPVVGTLDAWNAGGVVLTVDGDGRRTFPWSSVRTLELAHVRTRAPDGAGVGLLVGVVVGALLDGPPSCDRAEDPFCPPSSGVKERVTGALIGGVVGAGIGALLGSRIHLERWVPLSIPRSGGDR